MIKKNVFIFLLLGLFIISFASSAEWDNKINYENNDLKVKFSNSFLGLFETSDLGTAELKSHKSVNEILKLAPGDNRVVMYYDFDFKELYKNGLGEVEFINMTSGKNIQKDYNFMAWSNLTRERNNYSENCNNIYNEINNSYSEVCNRVISGTYTEYYEGWARLETTDIPKNKVRIGLSTSVNIGDHIDGIWTVAGKKIKKHSQWTESLNVGLASYWKMNDVSGLILDSLFTYNGTYNGALYSQPGIINTSIGFDGINDFVDLGTELLANDDAISIALWFNADTLDTSDTLMDKWSPQLQFLLRMDSSDKIEAYVGTSGGQLGPLTSTNTISTGVWNFVVITYDSTNGLKMYFNNNVTSLGATGTLTHTTTQNTYMGSHLSNSGFFDGDIDEVGIWNRALTGAEVTQLYNEGNGITYTDIFGVIVTQNYPENNSIINDASVEFNWTIIPGVTNTTNWTLSVFNISGSLVHQHINTSINTNQTITVIHNDTLLLDESYLWSVEACSIDTTCNIPINYTFTLDTAKPVVNITYPQEGFIVNTPQENITLNYTVFHPVGDLSNCFYNTTSNSTTINISCTTNTTSLLYPISNPINLTIFVFANDTAGNLGLNNVTIFKDTTSPQINITTPTGILDYNYVGGNETLNWTVSDGGLDSCWYNYNSTNVTVNCSLNTTNFILEESNLNLTFYANDTFGNENSSFTSWSYKLLELSTTYSTNITEGETNLISTKIVIIDDSSITSSILSFGVINYTTSIIYDGENYTIVSNNDAPIVSSDTNFSFNFIIYVDGINYTTTTNNQTVFNLDFGICGGISNDTLLNISLFDEDTLLSLVGDIEFNADIISKSSSNIIETINGSFNNIHSGAICFSPVSSYSMYYLDTEFRYLKDGYATEFYHIQKADLSNYPSNLSLFDLNQNDSTEFSVTYKNNNFIFTEGAIIQLQRKYIGEDIYRVVEAPLTGDGGGTILHIDLNTNKYQASVVKDGELLDFFNNIVFSCDNELSGDCTHSLQGTVNPNNDVDVADITDFSYSISIDEDNQTIDVLFAVPSGTPSSINVLLEQIDMFGNSTACNTTIITSAGSITCGYTDTIEKSILELSISKNDIELAVLSYVNDPELDMDGINFFIIFLFMISLVGMAIASPEWMIIISVMVLVIGGTLLLVSGMNLVMGLGAIAWVVIAAAIMIFKMAKQEDH